MRERKLILRCNLAPGDIILLTAAVRDLHRCYPGKFITDVRTPSPELWENNPNIVGLQESDPAVEQVDCQYPLINFSNKLPYHAIHGFKDFLNKSLGLNIQLTDFRGDIHLSQDEKLWASQVHEMTGKAIPFWVIAAGGKYDYTIKWWDVARYQKIVDHFRGKIQFVQVGAVGFYHPRLNGVIDLRGRTTLRQLVRLVYHSQGVLCPVTSLMHIAAAVETPPGMPAHRPCVVVAGGREPAHWEAYPHHQFLHTNGALPCCSQGGCWKTRTRPLGDGRNFDDRDQLCVDVVGDLPRCMDMITAEHVIERIEYYYKGRALSYLSPRQLAAAEKAVDVRPKYHYDLVLNPYTAKAEIEKAVEQLPRYPGTYSGRGIVICGGGFKYFPPAWVCINMLRKLGCELPIQLWYMDEKELDPEMERLLQTFGVQCINASQVRKDHPTRRWGGWELKPFAIAYSPFQEVLLLDADNLPLVNPEFLFETPEYKQTGAIFWPDIRRYNPKDAIWKITGLECRRGWEFESGQIVLNKKRCWRATALTLWYNEHSDFFYKHILGDKETFYLAFRTLNQPYSMPTRPVEQLEATMCQHDFDDRRIFQHRNLDKWNIWMRNKRIKGFLFENECRQFLRDLRTKWDGGMKQFANSLGKPILPPLKARSPASITAVMISCAHRDQLRSETLRTLAATDWGDKPVKVFRDPKPGSNYGKSLEVGTWEALEYGISTKSDYILFLEDDLLFNGYISANLDCWLPLQKGEVTLASLYNPNVAMKAVNPRDNYSAADPSIIYGSQAYILSRPTAQYILNHWEEILALPDMKMPQLAGRLNRPLIYHTPSLVQHVGRISVWGGVWHQAPDFSLTWRSPAVRKIVGTRSGARR